MQTNNTLAKAIRFALIGGASVSAMQMSVVSAAEADAGAKVERIAVTGSRIQRTDMETANPITVFNAEDIEKSGFSTVAEFLRTNAASGGFNESSTLSQAAGASSVGLKGFASDYTLILLNGRRLPKNSAGGIFTDVNQVPMTAVARIDILPDGASAIYGSDAVAGVINIITKTDFEGVALSAKYGAALEHNDGKELNVSVVAGASGEKTNILFTAEHFSRGAIQATDREFGRTAFIEGHPGGDGRSSWGIPGFTSINSALGEDGKRLDNAAKGEGSVPWSDCPENDVLSNGRCAYDFASLYQIQPETERQSLFTSITHEASDDLVIDGQFRYTRAYTLTSNAPAPGQVDVSQSPFLADFLRNDRYKDDAAKADEIIRLVEAGEAVVSVGRRYIDFPNRQKDNTNETFEAVVGMNYNIDDNWALDFDLGHSKLTNRQIGAAGQLLASNVADAFNDPESKLNPFIVNDCSSDELAEICRDLQAAIHRTGEYDVTFSSLVLNGLVGLELPGGEVGIATGVDMRKEKYQDRSDPATVNGEVIGGAGSNGGGKFDNIAGFLEVSLPLVENMELNLAVRHDKADWDLSDASDTTYSAKVSYRPIDDLLLRASYGTGFKAPNLSDLFTSTSAGVQRAIDTKLCQAAGNNPAHPDCKRVELNSKSGGNPELKPETSVSYNVGAVYQLTDELSFSLDYWSLKIEDVVGSLAIQEILDEEAKGNLTNLVVRNSEGRLTDSARQGYVKSNLQNLSEQSATGLIYDLQYNSEFSFGNLSANLHAEQFLTYKQQSSAVQPLCDDIADDAARKFRLNGSVTYQLDDIETSLNMRFLPGFNDYEKRNTAAKTCQLIGYYDVEYDEETGDVVNPGKPQHNAAYFQLDWTTAYYFADNNKLTFGIRNLLDRQPSFSAPNDWPFYSQGTYDNIGRFAYLQYDVKF
ncbi:TonB-dependent receptor domain-containing protein [Shewanella sedimentimangrovi]|uniref:TonB-dependent receptor n=1 Tax=Shewanella sedimentimangrovi TaxID=2814293 RepID=A0ABX7QYL0_9GAMM|nr:TonB-dependent receptor [Shewanella sedimentimangrovi]QSX35893.1 TonB-dependent receptor [Shewanella sedimentimangrovi]